MSNTFNPSLGSEMNRYDYSAFGLCVSMPFLPSATEAFKTKPVFNQADGCMYRCILENDVWVWDKITDGTFRQYIFSTLPLTEKKPTIAYEATGDQTPQDGTQYFIKNSLDEYEEFTGTTFESGTTYYVMTVTVHDYNFNDIVDTVNSLLLEFKRWRVTFVNTPESGQYEDATFKDMVLIINEMIAHVNKYSNKHIVPYRTDEDGNIVSITDQVLMHELIGHLNNLISAVNPYIDVLITLQRALKGFSLAGKVFDFGTTQGVMDALKVVIELFGGEVTNAPSITPEEEA